MARAADPVSDRWAARPGLGAALRLLALLGPVVVGLVVALLLARVVAQPSGGAMLAGWWALVLGGSALAVVATDRLARRLLPLAILLELSLIFPDRAPSRLRAARTSSVRDLDSRLARLRSQGVTMQPYEAAETVVTLVGILGLHDKRTRGHSERVRAFTDLLTCELGLDEDDRMRLRWAALVHDLGKLTVPAAVLNSSGGLDGAAWDLMHKHPDEGVRLLAGLLPWLGEWGDAVGQHHERYDGLGYPRGIAGEQISYAARIVSLADSFEVMTSGRSYKASHSAAWARGELTRCAGTQFDPALVRAFLGISIGRLRWVLGPVTWLAELPFVASADRAGQTVKVASVTAMGALLLTLGGVPDLGRPVPLAPGTTTAAAAQGPVAVPGGSRNDRLQSGWGEWSALSGLVPTADGPSAGTPDPGPASVESLRAAGGLTAARPAQPAPVAVPGRAPAAAPSAASRPAGSTAGATTGSTSGAAQPSPRPAATPGPALAPTYHLTSRGLQREPSAQQEVLSLPIGSAKSFDTRLDRAVVLPERREVVLFVKFPTRQGSAKLAARLLDCTAAGCSELSTGLVTQDKRSIEEFQPYVVTLNRAGPDVERLPAGHLLRLEVRFLEPGAKAPGRVALGSTATPSRLLLPVE